jgi:3,5-epimerase/4-reductase
MADNLLMERAQARGIGQNAGKPLRVLILRPRQFLSPKLSPRNALAKMLTYNKFIDTPNSCTVVPDFLRVTEELVKKGATGIYNVANPGVTTPYKIAIKLKEIIKPELEPQVISKDELNRMTLAKRIDSVLSIKKLEDVGITMPHLDLRLPEIIMELKDNLATERGMAVLGVVQKETEAKLSLKQ